MEGRRPKVLAVDDSGTVLHKISEALGGDAEVTCARSGRQALECLQRADDGPFGLILLDVHMPGMDGLELLTEIRKIRAYETTTVAFLTTESSKEQKSRGKELGAIAWIVKPFSAHALQTVLKRVQ